MIIPQSNQPPREIESQFKPLLALTKLMHAEQNRTEERAKANHERFNVFTTLLPAGDEVRLHTRFLHNLLNPKGSHDCGPLFLNLFLETLFEIPGVTHKGDGLPLALPEASKTWVVEKEAFRRAAGQIDLLLETAGYGIAIENKIFAAEQHQQLARYAKYLTARHGSACSVLYLTLEGKPGATHGDAPYLRISYSQHILTWLEKCLRETYRMIPINQVLQQYRQVVRHLTGQTLESSTMKSVSDFITAHPDIVRFQQQITAGIAEALADYLDRLSAGIMADLTTHGFQVRLRKNLQQGRFGVDTNGAFIIMPPTGSPLRQLPCEIWVEHFSKWRALIIGLESKYDKPAPSEASQSLLAHMNTILTEHAASQQYQKANPSPSWAGTFWPVGWRDIISGLGGDHFAAFLETPLPTTVDELSGHIRSHIKLLEGAYLGASGADGGSSLTDAAQVEELSAPAWGGPGSSS